MKRTLIAYHTQLVALLFTSKVVPSTTLLGITVATGILCVPAVLWMWHLATVRRILHRVQFAPGKGLFWLVNRRLLAIVGTSVGAFSSALLVVLQSPYFDKVTWVLLLMAPWLFVLMVAGVRHAVTAQFSNELYAGRFIRVVAAFLLVAVLLFCWAASVRYGAVQQHMSWAGTAAEAQAQWTNVRSSIVRLALDMGAINASIEDSILQLRPKDTASAVLALFIAPGLVFAYIAGSLCGLSLGAEDIRRIFGSPTSDESAPDAVSGGQCAVWMAAGVIVFAALVQTLVAVEGVLSKEKSLAHLQRMPDCERIGEFVYKLGTIDALKTMMNRQKDELSIAERAGCSLLDRFEAEAEKAVDKYLDEYFSLRGEAVRIWQALNSTPEKQLEDSLKKAFENHQPLKLIERDLESVRANVAQTVGDGSAEISRFLGVNRIVLQDKVCRVQASVDAATIKNHTDYFAARAGGSAFGGMVVGTLAAGIAKKAMAKASTKLAVKLLTKSAANAAMNSVITSTLGTLITGPLGPIVGFIAGVGVTVGSEYLMIKGEESLRRADMKDDLMNSVKESLRSSRFACASM